MAALIASSTALLYTPLHEHFGIAPLEPMQMDTPVIAVPQGGPVETVGKEGDRCGGVLSHPSPQKFAESMINLARHTDLHQKLS